MEIDELKNLKSLKLNSNLLQSLPLTILGLASLDCLELNKNKLAALFEQVDPSLVVLEGLTFLSLNGN
jgi:Leucine-rich repeat (LRR) protein